MGDGNDDRRNSNNDTVHHLNHRQQRINGNMMGNIGGVIQTTPQLFYLIGY